MTKNLVIVESPAKAKTIEKFLGKDFSVKSCYGHIRDLAPDKISIEVDKGYKPHYEIPADKKKLVKELKKMAEEAEQIWLATDEDREGEAISWHLKEALKLDDAKTRRIVFHEITKNAILKAISNPRQIDKHLVDAQQARRILDRLVGFELSPVLWKKIKPALSAGRVQSVAVRLIVDREREINNFEVRNYFKITAEFHPVDATGKVSDAILKAELPEKLENFKDAETFLNDCIGSDFTIAEIEKKPSKRTPSAPFTTSTLQQEASRKLNFSVARTMTIAQKLYEAGYITYMRTDSVNLSQEALNSAKEEIINSYGDNYSKTRQYKTKSQGAQEAHEAIRPTYMDRKEVPLSDAENRLYELIWKRTIASQMADAQIEKTNVKIDISKNSRQLNASGEVIKFDGFLKVYIESTDDEEEEGGKPKGLLPPISKGQRLDPLFLAATEKFNRPPARYTEASLVKKLEELGIGRPSTYAPTISTIQKRGYAMKENKEGETREYIELRLKGDNLTKSTKTENHGVEKGKLFPSNIGMVVNDFLMEHFINIMDFNFTARVEKEFDEIASGGKKWKEMIDDFYTSFHPTVEETENIKERVTGEKLLGEDPATGKNIYAKIGRYGPYVQKGEGGEENEKPEFAKLKAGQLIETITIEEALDLFKLPRELGDHEGEAVTVGVGRYGPYVRHKGKFYSIPKEEDPYNIELENAVQLIEVKKLAEEKKNINTFDHEGQELQILRGPYGPYIKYGGKNFKIPKNKKAEELTAEECVEIINDPSSLPQKRKGGKKRRKKS